MNLLLPRDIVEAVLNDKKTKNARVAKCEGSEFFLELPSMNAEFPAGKIILKLGDSGFYNKRTKSLEGAYGLRHIWDKHRVEIGATSAEDIVIFLESILLAGAEVLIDPKKGQNKAIVVESGTGMMILELKKPNGEDPYYSIITAYDRKSHPGTKLHTII
ncbi:hypothetical protein JGE14_23070 [Salmonella enterica subsp. enterica serovar Derby]|nr:hypothetical protein [Salmonella enterica subsp. enterica serovar Derby]